MQYPLYQWPQILQVKLFEYTCMTIALCEATTVLNYRVLASNKEKTAILTCISFMNNSS